MDEVEEYDAAAEDAASEEEDDEDAGDDTEGADADAGEDDKGGSNEAAEEACVIGEADELSATEPGDMIALVMCDSRCNDTAGDAQS